jgi:hypothetical protein
VIHLLTYTLRAPPNERQDAHRVKHTVDINPEYVATLHDPADHSPGCDILLGTGLILCVEASRIDVRSHLEHGQ